MSTATVHALSPARQPARKGPTAEEAVIDWVERHDDRFSFHELLTECRAEHAGKHGQPHKDEDAARESFRLHLPREVLKAWLCFPSDGLTEAAYRSLLSTCIWELICEALAEKWTPATCEALTNFQLAMEAEAIRLELYARDAEQQAEEERLGVAGWSDEAPGRDEWDAPADAADVPLSVA